MLVKEGPGVYSAAQTFNIKKITPHIRISDMMHPARITDEKNVCKMLYKHNNFLKIDMKLHEITPLLPQAKVRNLLWPAHQTFRSFLAIPLEVFPLFYD